MKNKELIELDEVFKEIRIKWGIEAFEEISNYLYTLYRKIEDLIISRDNWKNKYMGLNGK